MKIEKQELDQMLRKMKSQSRINGAIGELLAFEWFVRHEHWKPHNSMRSYKEGYNVEWSKLQLLPNFIREFNWMPDLILKSPDPEDENIYLVEVKVNTGIHTMKTEGMKRAVELGFKVIVFHVKFVAEFEGLEITDFS